MDLAKKSTDVKRCVGFIPDRPFVYEKLSGWEFLRLIAGLYRVDQKPPLNHYTSELLEIFELHHWKDELIESYSHGMKQRLIMCASLLHQPKVLIVDEPMVGLDPKAARIVKSVFREQARKGTTIFMSTHSLEVAEEICEDIAIIQAGKIIAKGTAGALKRQAGVEGSFEHIFLKLTEGKQLAHERSLSAH
jgi:ABC-2 type transport system ATP-binding protein